MRGVKENFAENIEKDDSDPGLLFKNTQDLNNSRKKG